MVLDWIRTYWQEALTLATVQAIIAAIGLRYLRRSARAAERAAEASERSSEAAQRSADAATSAARLSWEKAHKERTPRFDIEVFAADAETESDLPIPPLLLIDYAWGPALDFVEVTIEDVQGFVRAIYLIRGAPEKISKLRPGDRGQVRITRPDQFGGCARVSLRCVAPDGEEWVVEEVVSAHSR